MQIKKNVPAGNCIDGISLPVNHFSKLLLNCKAFISVSKHYQLLVSIGSLAEDKAQIIFMVKILFKIP